MFLKNIYKIPFFKNIFNIKKKNIKKSILKKIFRIKKKKIQKNKELNVKNRRTTNNTF